MRRPTVHIIGAGLSGLSAAAHLAQRDLTEVVVHERGAQPGGRRRSFFDEALGLNIDSGNYLVWTHWRSTLALIDMIGARDLWGEPERAISFIDMAANRRWSWRPSAGRWPWQPLLASRRPPQTTLSDFTAALRLRKAGPKSRLQDFTPSAGPAADRIWRPLALAALNIEPTQASAALVSGVLREALQTGARPLLPRRDFGRALIEPLMKDLRKRDVTVRFERTLLSLEFSGDRAIALEFEHDRIDLAPQDWVLLAVPPWIASTIVPGLQTPDEFTATITVHYEIAPPSGAPAITAVINGPFHSLFCSADRISVSIRDAAADLNHPREELAAKCWLAIAALTGLSDELPAWRVIRQKRAAFAATPAQNALRPSPVTHWRNLVLAGGYVQNGLPETLEGAVRSGETAASLVGAAEVHD